MASSSTIYTFGNMINADIDSATSSATGYPKENLIDNNPDTYWKGTSTADQWVKFDLQAAYTIDCVFVFIHNYASLVASEYIVVYYSDNGVDWTAVTGPLTISSLSTPIAVKTANLGISHRYWQLKVVTTGGTVAELSMVGFGSTNSISVGNQWPEDDTDVFYNKTIKGDDGRDLVYGLNSRSSKEFTRSWLFNGTTNWLALQAAHQDSYGSRLPLVIVEGTTKRLVRFADDELKQNQVDYQLYKPKVKFIELPYILDGESF